MATIKLYATLSCPYCEMAKKLLLGKGQADIEVLYIDRDPQLKEAMIQLTGQRTVPQIFINTVHVGGYHDLCILDQTGKLDVLFTQKT